MRILFYHDSASYVRVSCEYVKTWFQRSYYSIERTIQIQSIDDIVNFKLRLRNCTVKELNLLESFHFKRWNPIGFPYHVLWKHQENEHISILATLMFPMELECQWEPINFLSVKPSIHSRLVASCKYGSPLAALHLAAIIQYYFDDLEEDPQMHELYQWFVDRPDSQISNSENRPCVEYGMILDFQKETEKAIKVWEEGQSMHSKYLAIRKTGIASDIAKFSEEIPFALIDLAELCDNQNDRLFHYLNIAKGIDRESSKVLPIPIGWLRAAENVDDSQKAIHYLEYAARYGIDSAYHKLAELYRNLDMYDKIESLYSIANEDSPSVLQKYGELLLKRGKRDDAMDVFMKDPLTGYKYLSEVQKSDGHDDLRNYFQNLKRIIVEGQPYIYEAIPPYTK